MFTPKPFIRCEWCKVKIRKECSNQRFCRREDDTSSSCASRFLKIRNRISHSFDGLECAKQLEKLEKLGSAYRFPKRFDVLNTYYGLKGADKIEKMSVIQS